MALRSKIFFKAVAVNRHRIPLVLFLACPKQGREQHNSCASHNVVRAETEPAQIDSCHSHGRISNEMVMSADLPAGEGRQLLASQQLLQRQSDPPRGGVNLQNTPPHALPLLEFGAGPLRPAVRHVYRGHQRPAMHPERVSGSSEKKLSCKIAW